MKLLPVAELNCPCPRGLYIAPWTGAGGELVLLAIRSDRRLAAPATEIPFGADSVAIAEQLQATLDAADPPRIRLI